MNKQIKWIFVGLLIIIIGFFGFTFTVKEGSSSIVTSFGRVRTVHYDAGLHIKWPSPFESVITYDTRSQYFDSGYTEILTKDKKNVIIQTYVIWNIEDALIFHNRIRDMDVANRYLDDLVANLKNGVIGNYDFSSLVSTEADNLKLNEISQNIESQVAAQAIESYGIRITSIKIKRLALPADNIQSVLNQMIADRDRYAAELIAEGDFEASKIITDANKDAAEIIAKGKLDAAEIDRATETEVAEIYAEAYELNAELFLFLKKLIALENSVNKDTVIIMRGDEVPFDVIYDFTENSGGDD